MVRIFKICVEHRLKPALAYHSIQNAGLLDTNRRVCEIQFSQLMSFTSASLFTTPEASRNYFAVRRNRNRRRGLDHSRCFRGAPQLHTWELQVESSQIVIYGRYDTRQIVRDFAVDAIDLIMEAQIPVVWALRLPNSEATFSAEDVLKYLVSQILRLNHTLLNERSAALNVARFQSATTMEHWFSLLGTVLEGLTRVFLIIDLGLLHNETGVPLAWAQLFEQFFAELRKRGVRTVLKVVYLVTRSNQREHLGELDQQKIVHFPEKRKSGRVTKPREMARSRKLRTKEPGRLFKHSTYKSNM